MNAEKSSKDTGTKTKRIRPDAPIYMPPAVRNTLPVIAKSAYKDEDKLKRTVKQTDTTSLRKTHLKSTNKLCTKQERPLKDIKRLEEINDNKNIVARNVDAESYGVEPDDDEDLPSFADVMSKNDNNDSNNSETVTTLSFDNKDNINGYSGKESDCDIGIVNPATCTNDKNDLTYDIANNTIELKVESVSNYIEYIKFVDGTSEENDKLDLDACYFESNHDNRSYKNDSSNVEDSVILSSNDSVSQVLNSVNDNQCAINSINVISQSKSDKDTKSSVPETSNKSDLNRRNKDITELGKTNIISANKIKKTKNVEENIMHSEKKTDEDIEEFLRASQGLNRCNKRIVKSYNLSDVLIIEDQNDKDQEERVDNWEELLDDNGLLDSSLLSEISKNVENITVTTPKEDHRDLKNRRSSDSNMAHVVEIYGFPTEFQTRDLLTIFENYRTDMYHIKWVDDTHALGVFPSEAVALDVLKIQHPLIKLRPMSEASKQAISKAKRNPNAMMPVIARPQTCPQTARRMVTGALGLKLRSSKEDREKEKQILKAAREKKRLAVKQQDDAWEGRISSM